MVINLCQSIFDRHESPDIESALKYMHKFGFVVPDLEYVSDLEGLLGYVRLCVYVVGEWW